METHVAVPRPSEVRSRIPSKVNSNRQIREYIDHAIEDDQFFDHLCAFALPPGRAGNRQMDQAIVSEMLFNKIPKLRDYTGLNHKLLWGHISKVFVDLGYKMQSGYLVGHYLEDMSNNDVDKAEEAA